MKAKQIQAQFDAQNRNELRHRSAKRGWMTGLAAAAAVLVFGTVTVGAVNNWDYSAVFNRYFSEKSGTETAFDFSGMGLDIGDTVEGDGFLLTVQSAVADTNNLYVAYDVALSDAVNAEIAQSEEVSLYPYLSLQIFTSDADAPYPVLNQGGADLEAVRDEDGIWHGVAVIGMEHGTALDGCQLRIENSEPALDDDTAIMIQYAKPDFDEKDWIRLSAPEKIDLCYDLTGITVQQGMVRDFGQTLPNDANENVFDSVTVTPFMLKFESTGHGYGYPAAPQWGMVWGDDREPVEFTAVYADGTERVLTLYGKGAGGGTSSQSSRNPEGGYDWELTADYYFTTPFTLDGLTEIRFNGRVITVA